MLNLGGHLDALAKGTRLILSAIIMSSVPPIILFDHSNFPLCTGGRAVVGRVSIRCHNYNEHIKVLGAQIHAWTSWDFLVNIQKTPQGYSHASLNL